MTRENISKAMDDISDKYLMEALDGITDVKTEKPCEEIQMRTAKETLFPVKHINRRKLSTVLIAAVLIFALGITAYAVGSRILMLISNEGSDTAVNFSKVDDGYIQLGTWLPTAIPDGYEMTFISEPFDGEQNIVYTNADEDTIRFAYAVAGHFSEAYMSNIIQEEAVSISGCEGILYTQENGQNLFWTNDLSGIGYSLNTTNKDIDLLNIAESVVASDEELIPTLHEGTDVALKELGDFSPAAIPAAYEKVEVVGSPKTEGGDWYGYVRKIYTDTVGNKTVSLNYETYFLEDNEKPSAEDVLVTFGIKGTAVTVYGNPGILSKDGMTVCWVDMEQQLKYTMTADTISGDSLVELANSVCSNHK